MKKPNYVFYQRSCLRIVQSSCHNNVCLFQKIALQRQLFNKQPFLNYKQYIMARN